MTSSRRAILCNAAVVLITWATLRALNRKRLARRHAAALNAARQLRLDAAKAAASKLTGLENLKQKLPNADMVTALEANQLPPVLSKTRFYPVASPGAKYANWIDRVWNKGVVSFPAVIVRVATPADVAACVKYCAEHKLNPSIAGGCHGATAMVDNVFVIDMVNMNGVSVDVAAKQVTIGAGATLSMLDAALAQHGLVVPVGTNGDTGVAGLTLSGGNGWMARKFGLTIDNLIGLDVVDHQGNLRNGIREPAAGDNSAEATYARELLWACRGAGGHFGIVTAFTFQAHDIPNGNKILHGQVVHLCLTSAQKAKVVANWWSHLSSSSNDTIAFCVLPAGVPVVPVLYLHMGAQATTAKHATDVPELKPTQSLGGVVKVSNKWKRIDYQTVQGLVAAGQGHGYLYQTMVALNDFNATIAAYLAEKIASAPAGSVLIIMPKLGASDDNDRNAERCAYSLRHCRAWIIVECKYDPLVEGHAEGNARCAAWCKAFVADINETHPGVMAHTSHAFSDVKDQGPKADPLALGQNVMHDSTNAAFMKRLAAAKELFDPQNMFSHNRKLPGQK